MFGFWRKKAGRSPRSNSGREAPNRGRRSGSSRRDPQALRTLGQDFLPEELEILAVTGANPFSGSQGEEGEGLWPAFIGLTAWMEADGPELHQGAFRLETIADNQLMPVLRQRARPDFIIRFRARRSEDGTRLLLLDLPEPGFDPELKAILDEQKKPVTFWVDGLGTFALNRALGWFEAEARLAGKPDPAGPGPGRGPGEVSVLSPSPYEGAGGLGRRLRACAARTCWSWPTTGPATGAVRSWSRKRSPGTVQGAAGAGCGPELRGRFL